MRDRGTVAVTGDRREGEERERVRERKVGRNREMKRVGERARDRQKEKGCG